jgi:hypothetical protein
MRKFVAQLSLALPIALASSAFAAPFPSQTITYNFGAEPESTAVSGWQKPILVTIHKTADPEGQINYSCPSKFPVAVNGSETFDSAGDKDTILVISNGLELKNAKTQTNIWSFYFRWPNKIRSTETVTVNVYCVAK